MKRVLFFVMALATMAITSQTQAQVKFGAKAGLNLSRVTEHFETMKPGFHGGIYAQINLHPMFSIQPEVLYSMQGGMEKDVNEILNQTISTKTTLTSHNVIVPIMLQFSPIKMITIEAGPQFGFNLGMSSHRVLTTQGIVDSETESDYTFESDDYNMFDFGLAAGLKLNVASNVNIYARYNFGLTNVFVYEDVFGYEDDETFNQNLMLGVGFTF